jgi:hypothetical protein
MELSRSFFNFQRKKNMKEILIAAILAFTMSFTASAGTYGPLANFDVINDTGVVAHGFEIEIDGINQSNITSLFGEAKRWPGMERYGVPVVTTTGTGVRITYMDLTKSTPNSTAANALTVVPTDSCWPLGAPGKYGPNYPCDHFGVSTNVATPVVRYHWLVESTPGSTSLTPVDASVPNPQVIVAAQPAIWVQPPAPAPAAPLPPMVLQPQPPVVHAVMVAPAPNAYEFGEPRWVKVTATGTMQNIGVEELMGDNALIKNAQTQIEWQRLQYDANKAPGGANGTIDLTGVKLDPGAVGIAYRFEYYAYNGAFDPQTHEAITGVDTSGSKTPPATVGAYLGAQMVGVNFDGVIPPAPPLPIAPTINASIAGGIVGKSYTSSFNVTPYNVGDVVDVIITGLPAGLSYGSVNGLVTVNGTPAVVGSFPITIIANDTTNNTTISANTSVDIADAPMVFNVAFNAATVGAVYNYPFSITGGYGALTYSTVSTLPAGMSIINDTLSGAPTIDGSFPITMTVKDSLGFSQNAAVSTLVVNKAPAVVVPPVIPAPIACSGTNAVMTSGSPLTIEIGGGIANAGQTVDVPATITFVAPLTVINAYLTDNLATFSGFIDNATKHCAATTASIAPGLSTLTPTPYHGQVGVEYSPSAANLAAGVMAIQVNVTGGIAPYTVAVSGLPLGMSIDATNKLVGIPTVAGTYQLSISVNDNNGQIRNSAATLVIDPAPVAISCSGTNEVITQIAPGAGGINPTAGWLLTNIGLHRVQYPNQANTVIAPGASFAVGSIVSYSGTIEPSGVFCVANSMSISAPVFCAAPKVRDAATNTCVTPACPTGQVRDANGVCAIPPVVCTAPKVRNAATNTCVTPACPTGQVRNANGVCAIPPVVCAAPKVRDATKNTCVTPPVVAPASCVAPAGSKSVSGHAAISSVSGTRVVISGKTVNTLGCTKITYKGHAKGLVIGYDDEYKGYSVSGVIYATSMIVNDGQ